MKTIIIFLAASSFVFITKAQSVLRYEFQNSLNEKNGSGPALAVLGNTGTYVLDTLNEISGNTKIVYRFEFNSGFQFDNAAAGNFIGDTYSIELYFVFDDLNSWKRVTDWKNRKTDDGAYVYNGQLNFYPYVYSTEAPVEAGEYTYYVITRDGTGQLFIYTDADVEIDFMDSYGDALVDADNVINFFHDDLSVPNEASSGAVALLNLYNYVLDSNIIKENFENIGGQVFSINDIRKSATRMTIYPNPAVERTTVDFSGFDDRHVAVEIYNAAGIKLLRQTVDSSVDPRMEIHTSSFAEGIYLIKAESADYISSQKLVIIH
jgi:OOP family OmpA-OmpF porin